MLNQFTLGTLRTTFVDYLGQKTTRVTPANGTVNYKALAGSASSSYYCQRLPSNIASCDLLPPYKPGTTACKLSSINSNTSPTCSFHIFHSNSVSSGLPSSISNLSSRGGEPGSLMSTGLTTKTVLNTTTFHNFHKNYKGKRAFRV